MEINFEINKLLCKKYPFLKIQPQLSVNWYDEMFENEYSNTWMDAIPTGWRVAFSDKMCEELLHILEKANFVEDYTIVQIKEKFGTLRWYSNGVPDIISEEYYDWLRRYEDLSWKTCINCGQPAEVSPVDWVLPLCSKCAEMINSNSDDMFKFETRPINPDTID